MAAIAEFYSANLAQETQKGMRMRVEQGGWPFQAPRGYRNRRTPEGRPIIEIEPNAAAAVRRIFELYASGTRSFYEVAAILDREGLPRVTPPNHFRRLLTNRFYIGFVRWHGVECRGNHMPLISTDLFQRASDALAKRRQPYSRQPATEFVLRGVAVCDVCGTRLTAETHEQWNYYRCWSHNNGSAYSNASLIHQDLLRVYGSIEVEQVKTLMTGELAGCPLTSTLDRLASSLDVAGQALLARTLFKEVRVRYNNIVSVSLRSRPQRHTQAA